MVKFKKGDKVIRFRSWGNDGSFYAKELTVESWGFEVGTATGVFDGKFLKERIYVKQANATFYNDHFFLSGTVDVEAKALELAQIWIDENVKRYTATAERAMKEGREGDVKHYTEVAAKYRAMTPSFAGVK